jgi:hypothetical protein
VSYLFLFVVLFRLSIVPGWVEILNLKVARFRVVLGSWRLFGGTLGCDFSFLVTKLEALLSLEVILVLLVPKLWAWFGK